MGGQFPFQEAILFPMTVCIDRNRPEERIPVRRVITKKGGSRYTISLCWGFLIVIAAAAVSYFQSLKISFIASSTAACKLFSMTLFISAYKMDCYFFFFFLRSASVILTLPPLWILFTLVPVLPLAHTNGG